MFCYLFKLCLGQLENVFRQRRTLWPPNGYASQNTTAHVIDSHSGQCISKCSDHSFSCNWPAWLCHLVENYWCYQLLVLGLHQELTHKSERSKPPQSLCVPCHLLIDRAHNEMGMGGWGGGELTHVSRWLSSCAHAHGRREGVQGGTLAPPGKSKLIWVFWHFQQNDCRKV